MEKCVNKECIHHVEVGNGCFAFEENKNEDCISFISETMINKNNKKAELIKELDRCFVEEWRHVHEDGSIDYREGLVPDRLRAFLSKIIESL